MSFFALAAAASKLKHAFQKQHRNSEHMLIQKNFLKKQIKYSFDYKYDIFNLNQFAD